MDNAVSFESYFAKAMLKSSFSESAGLFLESLWRSVKEGHLCVRSKGPVSLPSFLMEEAQALFPKTPIVKQSDRYYLQKNWVLETYVLEQVKRLRKRFFDSEALDFAKNLERWQGLLPEQKEIVQKLFDSPFAVLCGGPGTGKTYTAGSFVHLLASVFSGRTERRCKIALTAPTGKAALHLQASLLAKGPLPPRVDFAALTLHRLLKLKPGELKLFSPRRLDFDLVVVDEASMVDVSLLAHLLESIGDETRVILMGDPNQLPPVDAGGLFADFASLFGFHLTRCMRTEEPLLQKSAHSILAEDETAFFESVSLREEMNADSLYERIQPMISWERPDPKSSLAFYSRLRVLNALRQGPMGVDAMNRKILQILDQKCQKGQWWAIPIMIGTNLPHLNLYNGSVGILIGQKQDRIDLSSGIGYFLEKDLEECRSLPFFEVCFVLSIHKSQGSEFEEVIAICPEGSENFGKEALYTAATRAKKKWELVGKKETIQQMLRKSSRKMSGFIDRFPSLF